MVAKTDVTDAAYLQTGHTWVESQIVCHMSEKRQVALSICVRGRVVGKVGVPPKKVGG